MHDQVDSFICGNSVFMELLLCFILRDDLFLFLEQHASNHNMYNREAGEQQKVILMQHKSRLFGSQLCGVIRQQFQYGNEKKKIVKCEKCAGTILTYIDNTTIIGYTSLWILRSHFQVHKLSSHWLPRVNKRFEQQVGLNTAKNKNKLPEIECLLPKTVELEGFP